MKNEQKKNYEAPCIKIVELEVQSAFLEASRYGGELGMNEQFNETQHG